MERGQFTIGGSEQGFVIKLGNFGGFVITVTGRVCILIDFCRIL